MQIDNSVDLVAPLPDRPEYFRGDAKDAERIKSIRQLEQELSNRKFCPTTQGQFMSLYQKVSQLERYARSYFHDPPNLGSPILALDVMLHSLEDTDRAPTCRSLLLGRLLRASLMLLTENTYAVRRDILIRIARVFAFDDHAQVRQSAFEYLHFYYQFLRDWVADGAPSADLSDPETHEEIGRIITSSFSDGTMLTEQCSMVNDVITAAQTVGLMQTASKFVPRYAVGHELYVVPLPTEKPVEYRRTDFGNGPDSEDYVAIRNNEQILFENPDPSDFINAASFLASYGKRVFLEKLLSRETALAATICGFAIQQMPAETARTRLLVDLADSFESDEDIPTYTSAMSFRKSHHIRLELLDAVATHLVSARKAREREAALRVLTMGLRKTRELMSTVAKAPSQRDAVVRIAHKVDLFRRQEGTLSVYEVTTERLQAELRDWVEAS